MRQFFIEKESLKLNLKGREGVFIPNTNRELVLQEKSLIIESSASHSALWNSRNHKWAWTLRTAWMIWNYEFVNSNSVCLIIIVITSLERNLIICNVNQHKLLFRALINFRRTLKINEICFKTCETKLGDMKRLSQLKANLHHIQTQKVLFWSVPAIRVLEMCPDCPNLMSSDNDEVKRVTSLSLEKFNKESGLKNRFALLQITRATSGVRFNVQG